MKIKPFLLAALVAAAVPAWAQTPDDAALNRLYEALQVEKQLEEMKSTLPAAMSDALKQGIPEAYLANMNPEQRRALAALEQDIGKTVVHEAFNPDLYQKIKQVWTEQAKKHLTDPEVKAATAFYRSPEGQNFVRKNAAMTPDFLRGIMPAVNRSQQEIMERHGKRWQREFKAIFADRPQSGAAPARKTAPKTQPKAR